MAKHLVLKGDTSRIEYIFIQNSSVTTGAGLTGLVFNSASLVAYYVRTQGSATAITLATQTVTGAFSSGGFVEVDATNMPGVYRFDPPDAAFASGVDKVVIMLKGATNMAPVTLEYQLVNFDPEAALATPTNITAGTITTATNVTTVNGLAANVITAASIAADAITAAKVADGTIDAATFAAGAINAAAIAADAITAAKIADGAIDRATLAADTGLQSIRSGTAQAGAAGTITLDASASATTDFYVGLWVYLTGATGAGQARVCTAYNGTTKVATIAPNWATNPDATSTFALMTAAQITGVQGNITGSVASVTGAVGSVTGAVGSVAANGITEASLAADARTRIQTECEEALAVFNLDHLVGTATAIPAIPAGTFLDQIMDDGTATYDRTTDSLQAIRDASASLTDLGIIASTTIATLASQTSFTLTAGSADNNAYLYCRVVITDATTAVQKAIGKISAYVGATKTVTLEADPGIFTMAAGDLITILPPAALTANAVGSGEFTQAAADKVWSTATRALTDKVDFRLSTTGIADIWAYVIEGTWTAVMYMRLFGAALLAKCSGMGTATAVFRDVDDTKNRLSVTVDSSGNRSAFGTRDGT